MANIKKLLCFIVVLGVVFIVLSTDLKLYLPWYRLEAIKIAEEFYYQTETREIKYDRSECHIIVDSYMPFYRVYFYDVEYPENEVWVHLEYDRDKKQFGKRVLFK